jgi:hypothetical protein
MTRHPFAFLLPLCCITGCGITLLQASVTNPAKTSEKMTVTQSYEIGPYKENHRYELSLTGWTPTSIGLDIKLVDSDSCASPKSYTFTLVDDQSHSYPLTLSGEPTTTTETGRANKTLTVATVSGTFAAAISASTRSVLVQMRSLSSANCPSLDFKWSLN